MRRPATTNITLTFGYHDGYPLHDGFHQGVDFAYTPDNQIYAPTSGKVSVKHLNGDDGNAVYMSVGNQFHGLCHMASFAVVDGQQVAEGQVLGIMGDTGAAEGTHLHWAVKVNGSFVDPLTLVDEQGDDMTIDQATNLAQRIGLLAGMSEAEVTTDWLAYHAQHIAADPTYAAGLAKQLYDGNQWQTMAYKAGHYDADVKTAQSGKVETVIINGVPFAPTSGN